MEKMTTVRSGDALKSDPRRLALHRCISARWRTKTIRRT